MTEIHKRILVLPAHSPFMQVDADILGSISQLKVVYLDQDKSKLQYLKGIFKTLWVMLRSPGYKQVLVWFADYHAAPIVLLAKLLRNKSYIFIGGYDAVKYPKLGMGVYCSWVRGLCAGIALKNCTHIIANHHALLSSLNTYYDPQGHPDGVYKLIPGLGTPSSVIYNALASDPPAEFPLQRIRQIVTVGSTPRFNDYYNKGFDLLTEIAKRRTDLKFIFVGIRDEWMEDLNRMYKLSSLPNVIIHHSLSHPEVLELMRVSAAYAQPSISEGMPNALMEAMLMGCVPVGSNVAGIPTVIGDLGYIINEKSSKVLEAALDKALISTLDPQMISKIVEQKFCIKNRKDSLARLLAY